MAAPVIEMTEDKTRPTHSSDKVNILMVDDQPGKLMSYEVILAELNENLIKATSGKHALECLLKEDIAIVLMDVSMPDLDGFELAEMIRQHPRFQNTAIIFISAVHLEYSDQLQGYQRGGVDYVSVPVVPELLRAKVRVFAELHRKTIQLERLNGDLVRLSGRLLTMQDEERRRIARELHDGLGQELAAAKMLLDQRNKSHSRSQEVEVEVAEIINRALLQVRSISHLLHPPLLDEVGLASALTWYISGFSKRSGIETSIEIDPPKFPRLSGEMETCVFRIIQEALTNVFRHSKARKASVKIGLQGKDMSIMVSDNGIGITQQVSSLESGSIGMGIGGMRQRIREFNGKLTISPLGETGTALEVTIPHAVSAPIEPGLSAQANR
jgi:signal transduction histidine kinase